MLGFMLLTFFTVFVCGNGKDSRGFQFVALDVTLLYARLRIVLFDCIILLKFFTLFGHLKFAISWERKNAVQ